MFGLFGGYDSIKFDIELLERRVEREHIDRLKFVDRVRELEAQVKALDKDRYKELESRYKDNPKNVLKNIYDTYKYTRFCDAPAYVQDFVVTKFFVNLNSEKRTIGEILELSYPTVNCIGCSKLEESKEEGCKCEKKKGKKK